MSPATQAAVAVVAVLAFLVRLTAAICRAYVDRQIAAHRARQEQR